MKRLKLNLDELSRELEMLDAEYLRGLKGGYGEYGGYNSWEELWKAMQHGYQPPAGTYYPGGDPTDGSYGNYNEYGGYNNQWPGGYPPGTDGNYGNYGDYGTGGYGSYGEYGGYGGPFPKITFDILWNSYQEAQANGDPAHPSNDGYVNQCAIRVGKALHDGFDIDFTDASYTEQFGPVTTEGYPRGAKSLADYLEGNGLSVTKMSYTEWQSSEYRSSKGIIFIKGAEGYADHIDVYNNGATGSGIYSGAQVWFFPLE